MVKIVKSVRTQALAKRRRHRAPVLHPSFGVAKPPVSAGIPPAGEVYWSPNKKVEFYSFDAEYLRRLQARDQATETHFVSYFTKRLQVKLRSRGFAGATLEDISQTTFVRVLTAVQNGTVQFPERFGAFVSAVCDNVIQEQYRDNVRNQYVDVDALDLPDRRTNLEAMLLRKEKKRIVADILAELPAKKRNILRALLFEQLDRRELCARFKVKGDYLRVLLFRAKEDFAALCKARGLDRLEEGRN